MGPQVMSQVSLKGIFLEVAERVDGARLVKARLEDALVPAPAAVLAVGKVAVPMFNGLLQAGISPERGLLIAPANRFPADFMMPSGCAAMVADHPEPSERSLKAAATALAFVRSLSPEQRLLVLLSGGGSALLCAPAPGLSLQDKRNAVQQVARGGATIAQLNTVRKHLSAIKGGQLGAACKAPTTVLALSDVVGNDPATIASGPFCADPTSFSEAQAILRRFAPQAPAAVKEWIDKGVRGEIRETPKPTEDVLSHIQYEILASPNRVVEEARLAVERRGHATGSLLCNVETDVEPLAQTYVQRAQDELRGAGAPRVFIGNGEPSIVVRGRGQGGRATHLALLVAKGIAGLSGVQFLAAGTDDRDGSADASGALVDGQTWSRVRAAGVDPEAALNNSDSATALAAAGALLRGPGTSNLLDLHLLLIHG